MINIKVPLIQINTLFAVTAHGNRWFSVFEYLCDAVFMFDTS